MSGSNCSYSIPNMVSWYGILTWFLRFWDKFLQNPAYFPMHSLKIFPQCKTWRNSLKSGLKSCWRTTRKLQKYPTKPTCSPSISTSALLLTPNKDTLSFSNLFKSWPSFTWERFSVWFVLYLSESCLEVMIHLSYLVTLIEVFGMVYEICVILTC